MITYTAMAGFGRPGLLDVGSAGGYPGSTVCPLCLAHHEEIIVLECGHEFCKRCLRQRTDGNMLKCPSCFRLINLHDEGVEGLQGNYLINNILKIVSIPDDAHSLVAMRSVKEVQSVAAHPDAGQQQRLSWYSSSTSHSGTSPPLCQICHVDLVASKFCVNCQAYMCSACHSAHNTCTLPGERHQIVSPSTSSSNELSPANPSTQSYCTIHHSEILEFCCNHCIQPVCRECVLQEHIGHPVVRLGESAQEFRRIIPTLVHDLKTKDDCINSIIIQVEHVLDSVEKRAKSVSSEVHNCIQTNIAALEEKEQELLSQVETIRKIKLEVLSNQNEELKSVKNRVMDAVSLVRSVHQARHDSELVNIRQCLQQTINKIQGDMSQLTICHEDDHLVYSLVDHGIKSAISQIGTVASSVSSIHTTASGHGIYCAIVGKYAKFAVTCRNHCNQKVSQPRETIDVKIYAPDASPVKVDIFTKHDSVYEYRYYPNTTGTYTISIRLRGRHISGSPMKAKVRKRRNYFNIGGSDHQIGGDGESPGQFCRPWGICCDLVGHIIVADRSNNRVQIFNPDGSFKYKFGQTGSGHGQFNRPAGVAVDSHNHIVVTDKDNHRVQVFTFEGQFVHSFGERGSLNGQLHYPWDVACNAEDCILVSDTRNHRIQLFSPTGQYLNKYNFHSPPHQRMQPPQPRGVCFTESGDMLVTDFNKHRLMVLRRDFQTIHMFGNEGQGNGQFFRPQGVAVDLEGNILVSEGRNHRVQIFGPDLKFISKFGSQGKSEAEFEKPSGLCVTPDGYIIVVDFGNNRIMFF